MTESCSDPAASCVFTAIVPETVPPSLVPPSLREHPCCCRNLGAVGRGPRFLCCRAPKVPTRRYLLGRLAQISCASSRASILLCFEHHRVRQHIADTEALCYDWSTAGTFSDKISGNEIVSNNYVRSSSAESPCP